MGPTGASRILQIHPTRQCNLRCLHCYSSSGPHVRGTLDLELLRTAITDAAAEGYGVVSLSGGEPLLYEPLARLLAHAKASGMLTTLTTNGMLLMGRRLEALVGTADLIAISLDGHPSSHNQLRAHPRAFERMAANLPALRATGIPFGFIFTLTQHNLDEVEWVADFAVEAGARLLQIHPLELTGRASEELENAHPDRQEAAFAFYETARLQEKVGERLRVQLDLSHRLALKANPERVYGAPAGERRERPLAELVSPLVIEADGTVVPLEYGFTRALALGNLHTSPLRELSKSWKRESAEGFHALCERVHQRLTAPAPGGSAARPVLNWYEAMRDASRVEDGALAAVA